MFFDIDQQLLIYIRDERSIKKNKIVNTIEIRFFLFGKRKKLVISISIGFAINSIDKNIIHIAFGVNNRIRKKYPKSKWNSNISLI